MIAAISLSAFLFLSTATGMLILPRSPLAKTEVIVAIWANIAVMLVGLAAEARRRPYSLHMMHLLALFLFLGAPAILQYATGSFGVAGSIYNVRNQVLTASFAVLLWLLGYLIGYEGQRFLGLRRAGPVLRFLARPVMPLRTTIVLSLALFALGYLGIAGLAGVAMRGAAEAEAFEYVKESGTGSYTLAVYLIFSSGLRAFSLVALLAGILVAFDRRNRHPLYLFLVAVVAIGTLVANNPLAAPRMWFATVVVAYAAPLLFRRMRTGWALVVVALIGITLLPALHETRYLENVREWEDYFQLVSPFDYLAKNSDVDGLGMISLCQQWTERSGHSWGMQTLGSFLFWIPRTLWESKPIETGGMVTEGLGFEFTNLAPPVMADSLVDFGLPGIPVIAALFGIVLARFDMAYWEAAREAGRVRVLDVIYPFWIGCVLFITRGGSFASFSFTVSFTMWILPLALAAGKQRVAQRRAVAGLATPR